MGSHKTLDRRRQRKTKISQFVERIRELEGQRAQLLARVQTLEQQLAARTATEGTAP